MHTQFQTNLNATGLRVAIVVSQYHQEITGALRDAAVELFLESGGRRGDLLIVPAAGAFELTAVCQALAAARRCDAIVAIGCVISGQTTHDRYICQSLVQGLTEITLSSGVPIGFGVLTVQSWEQAAERAGGSKGNKGSEAMSAAIQTARTLQALASGQAKPAEAG